MIRTSIRCRRLSASMALLLVFICQDIGWAVDEHPLLAMMHDELKLSMDKLVSPDGIKPYFIQYAVTDQQFVDISATLGALVSDRSNHSRLLDVDVRCGDYHLDNTHQIRDTGDGGFYQIGHATLPLNGDPLGTRHNLWLTTDSTFKSAVERLKQVQANLKVKVAEEDQAEDFSKEKAFTHIGPWVELPVIDHTQWSDRIRKMSERFRSEPSIYNSAVNMSVQIHNRLLANSEGSKLQFGRSWWRIDISASTIAEDGMQLWQYKSFDAHTPESLPSEKELSAAVDQVIQEVLALRQAPMIEPYSGPAILMNRASGVFFHEIFGHRIEGHRQKDVEEGQTFAKKIGQEVLPTFLSVIDDPSQQRFQKIDLNGFYEYDDEGIPAQSANLVENGILKTFLMSRSPTRGFTQSNGHGRRSPGYPVVSRQGNLIVQSAKQVPLDQLRTMLIEESKKQGKSFGLLFEDISGGFTNTDRYGPQSFKVLPILVYRVYADGRADELVRGVDIVGTPLTCFSKILATADDPDVFNGVCGAESGWVPVSAISPSILVQQIEVEKRQKDQDRPPILQSPMVGRPAQP